MDDQEQLAWQAMPHRATVIDRGGSPIGTAESLLGDEGADIFHGIVIRRHQDHKLVEIAAASVVRITRREVETDLDREATAALPEYRHDRWPHLGWGGLFRRRPEWRDRE
jgi:hypothetical protein